MVTQSFVSSAADGALVSDFNAVIDTGVRNVLGSPRVSVVIPVFNQQDLITCCIRSVQAQTIEDLEIIVVDDASTDGTTGVVESLMERDERIRLVRSDRNMGPGMARNQGIAASSGAWIGLLDADDEYHPDRLRCLLETARSMNADMIADNLWLCSSDPASSCEVMLPVSKLANETVIDATKFVERNIGSGSTRRSEYGFLKPLIRKDFLASHDIHYDDVRFSEDYLLYLRCLIAGARWVIIPSPLYYYSVSDNSLTRQCTRDDLLRVTTAESKLLDSEIVKRDGQLSGAIERHRQSVILALSWIGFAEAVKRRDPLGAMNSLVSAPGAFAHITRESVRAVPRALARIAQAA